MDLIQQPLFDLISSTGKKAAKKLSDVEEEDEEEESEMPDLEEEEEEEKEGEKENEDLCNEGGAAVSKPKKKRKRNNKQDSSTEEPSNKKKNKTGGKSSEQGSHAFTCFNKLFCFLEVSLLIDFNMQLDFFSFVFELHVQMKPPYLKTPRPHFQRTKPTQTCNETLKNIVIEVFLMQIKLLLKCSVLF